MATHDPFGDALELAELLRPAWRSMSAALRASGVPLCEGDPDPDPVPVPDPTPDPPKPDASGLENENNRLRRLLAKHEKDARDAEEKRKADEGKWQQLAEERERERDEAAAKLAAFEREQRVTEQASKLGFRDPSDAHRFLDGDVMDDDKLLKPALEQLAKDRKYLIDDPEPGPSGLKKVLKGGEPPKTGDVSDDATPMARLEAAYAESANSS